MVLIGKTEFAFFTVCATTDSGVFFFSPLTQRISFQWEHWPWNTIMLSQENQVFLQQDPPCVNIAATSNDKSDCSRHSIWQDVGVLVWMHHPLTKTSPSAPLSHNELWVSLFFFHYKNTSHYRTHFKSVYKTDSGRFTAVSCGASSNNGPVPLAQLPCTNLPPSMTWFELN